MSIKKIIKEEILRILKESVEEAEDWWNTTPERLFELSEHDDFKVRKAVAGNFNSPPEILLKLSGDTKDGVRHFVALNLNSPPEALWKLSGDTDKLVRDNVAGNINCPIKALLILIKDPEPEVRESAKNNPRYKQYSEDVDRAEFKARDELEDALFD